MNNSNSTQLSLFDQPHESLFDSIRHVDKYDQEYWLGRELMPVLDYTDWKNFKKVIARAKTACDSSGKVIAYHFSGVSKMVELGSGSQRKIDDVRLSRYACYLIAMNGDPGKQAIADAQTYFAIQTRMQELGVNPKQLKENEAVTTYQLRGKSKAAAESRVGSKESQKQLNTSAAVAHENHKPDYGRIGTEQNQALFDMSKREIVNYLGLLPGDAEKYRDHLGQWATEALRLSSKEAARQLVAVGQFMTNEQIVTIIQTISRKVAEHVRALAELDHVDYLSGAPLDDQGRALINRNVRLLK